MRLPGARLMGLRGAVMDLFTKLLGDLLIFVYHCFDRIVIHGYLSGLSRPEQVAGAKAPVSCFASAKHEQGQTSSSRQSIASADCPSERPHLVAGGGKISTTVAVSRRHPGAAQCGWSL